ncbi:uncharacterized protein BJ171DRAFT_426063 [Polychytrium aggregatum]|uniref:uncharacterized protein n=1 Tax=Polychytrium aggregatum TaxID=110093 RepID=UPI0022FE0267|nr:uncharacterized protein BJ171DRAFT_426063 [Polychytrium aggregatum]KAI9202876.1 hypothetical protein BJ171DRAFT_426063 [Polychytrium aggregatum]
MAVSFQRIEALRGLDIADEFFVAARDAELHYHEEYDAAVTIQKAWRGYATRRWKSELRGVALQIQRIYRGYIGRNSFEKKALEKNHAKRMKMYNAMATNIQKIWRGYYSRKFKFDYYRRKEYIKHITKKVRPEQYAPPIETHHDCPAQMDKIREQLKIHESFQKQLVEEQREDEELARLEALAGRSHHLLSTKAIPGVWSSVPDWRWSRGNSNDAGTTKTDGTSLAPLRVPESKLQYNTFLKKWYRETIGRNHRGIQVKPPSGSEDLDECEGQKCAQGPFLPRGLMQKRRDRGFKPTLRVQTDYFDNRNYQLEEKRVELTQRGKWMGCR